MRKKFNKAFFDKWKEGFDCYLKGWWQNAIDHFKVSQNMIQGYEDGPSENLISYMQSFGGKAPKEWNGVRIMLSK